MKKLLGLFLFGMWILLPLSAHTMPQPSFDCKNKKTEVEKIVCSDESLSQADRELSATYKKIYNEASPNIQKELRSSQLSWLRSLTSGLRYLVRGCKLNVKTKKETCPIIDGADEEKADREKVISHLLEGYKGAKQALETSKIVKGDLVFYHIYYGINLPLTGHDYHNYDYTAQVRSADFLQINAPKNASERGFNKATKRVMNDKIDYPANEHEDNQDYDSIDNYADVHVTDDLIQVEDVSISYSGGAHGINNWHSLIWLRKAGRKISTSDVFDPKTDWKKSVNRLITKQLSFELEGQMHECGIDFEDTSRWGIDKRGILIAYQAYDCGSYMGPSATLTWDELKPYLLNPLPFKIPTYDNEEK